jgi:hypothetical protein
MQLDIDPPNLPDQARIVRTADEFQRAHDMLRIILLNETLRRALLGDQDSKAEWGIRATMDVLCWALGHAHNTTLAQNLERIALALKAFGVVMFDFGHLVPGEERPT